MYTSLEVSSSVSTNNGTWQTSEGSGKKNVTRLALVGLVALAAIVGLAATSGKMPIGGHEVNVGTHAAAERGVTGGRNVDLERCSRSLRREWNAVSKRESRPMLWKWVEQYPKTFKDAKVLEVDPERNGRSPRDVVSEPTSLGLREWAPVKATYREQASPKDGTIFLLWSDNTVVRVDGRSCRATEIHVQSKKAGVLGERMASDLAVRADKCAYTSKCLRDGTECRWKSTSCPEYFTKVSGSSYKCTDGGLCIECGCGTWICQCSSCPSNTCETKYDDLCPLRGGTSCSDIPEGVSVGLGRGASVVNTVVQVATIGLGVLPKALKVPLEFIAFFVGGTTDTTSQLFEQLIANIETALTNLQTCMDAAMAENEKQAIVDDIKAVKDALDPTKMRLTVAERANDNIWEGAHVKCNDLGLSYETRQNDGWQTAAYLLPTTVQAAEFCGLYYSVALYDAVESGQSSAVKNALTSDFQKMMTRTLSAIDAWINTINSAWLTDDLCGKFSDLRALVPPRISRFYQEVYAPVFDVAMPVLGTRLWYGQCLEDDRSRILQDKYVFNASMTIATCNSHCAGYKYFGVQNGKECFCGNVLHKQTALSSGSCSKACGGDSTERCGGTWAMNVRLVSEGCFEDSTTRVLGDKTKSENDMTVDKCETWCAGYKYFGVEYGKQCYCGNVMNSRIKLASSRCEEKRCLGNLNEYCGGSWAISVYLGRPVTGCVEDRPVRVLSGSSTTMNTDLSVSKCAQYCSGYQYYGVENGVQCFCGNVLVGDVIFLDSSRCNKPCSGQASEFCGGQWAMNVFSA